MNSRDLFLQKQYIKQLIQQEQLLQRYQSYFNPTNTSSFPRVLPNFTDPINYCNLNHQIESPSQVHQLPGPLPSPNLFGSQPHNGANYGGETKKFDWSIFTKHRNTGDAEFELATGYKAHLLNPYQLNELGLFNNRTGEPLRNHADDIKKVYGFGSTPIGYKLNKSLQDRITFQHRERQNFR